VKKAIASPFLRAIVFLKKQAIALLPSMLIDISIWDMIIEEEESES
jgi:hypothetical protein